MTQAPEKPVSARWEDVLVRFERELKTRGIASATQRAYRHDLREFASWASGLDLEASALRYRDLRAYAASISERGLSRATIARRLGSVRSLFDHLVRIEHVEQNPAELLPNPRRDSKLPRVLNPCLLYTSPSPRDRS